MPAQCAHMCGVGCVMCGVHVTTYTCLLLVVATHIHRDCRPLGTSMRIHHRCISSSAQLATGSQLNSNQQIQIGLHAHVPDTFDALTYLLNLGYGLCPPCPYIHSLPLGIECKLVWDVQVQGHGSLP